MSNDDNLTNEQVQRKTICKYIANRENEGATIGDVERAFPSMRYQDIWNALGICWAHGILKKENGMTKRDVIYFITALGVEKLGLPDGTWYKK